MNKALKLAMPLVALIVVFTGVIGLNRNVYRYHLAEAESSLEELQAMLYGKTDVIGFIPLARADEGDIDEEKIKLLVVKIDASTSHAIDQINQMTSTKRLKKALTRVADLQEEKSETYLHAIAVMISEEGRIEVGKALEQATQTHQEITTISQKMDEGMDKDQRKISIKMDKDHQPHKNIENESLGLINGPKNKQAIIQSIEATKESIQKASQLGGDEKWVSNINAHIELTEAALREGRLGRAYGLSIATQASSKHILKK